ncbi:ATP-binding protein [Streptomyces avermitilis]|uniref:ATP-binding protein n=1 Tax=Streptomyces avermitilis TaxID=33903 RepID=UPI003716236D
MNHPTPVPAGPQAPSLGTAQAGAHVALYTTSVNSRVAVHTLGALAEFAAQQGWTVVHEAYDLAPLHVPARLRTGWRSVTQLLDTGKAAGLVVPAEQEIARNPREQSALREWLLSIPAFAAYPHAGHHTASLPPANATSGSGAPVDRERIRSYSLTPASLRRLRDTARMDLTMLRWPGDIATAIEALSRLAHNAVVHARPEGEAEAEAKMTVRLAVDEDDVLLLEVEDPRPGFPASKAAIDGEKGSGLMYVRLLGAQVTWSLSGDARSKKVRARLQPGEVSP